MKRPIAFILAACQHGMMIVNKNDYHVMPDEQDWYSKNERNENCYGVGHELLNSSEFSMNEVTLLQYLLYRRREYFGDGVVAFDIGANIGTHTVELARYITGWGTVTAFEAQETIFYALAGNIVINNCLNAKAKFMALGSYQGLIEVPNLDYSKPASFGSLEIQDKDINEDIGQSVSRKKSDCNNVPINTIDSILLNSKRLDLLKIDVEGMEYEVLIGARHTLNNLKPIIFMETIKSDKSQLVNRLISHDYEIFELGINILAIHKEDPTLKDYIKEK